MKYLTNVLTTCVTFSLALASASALAGLYSDEMAKCLVKSTNAADRSVLVRWIFVAVAMHPEVKEIVSVSDIRRDESNKAMAKLLEALLTESCRSETQNAAKYEGRGAFGASFQILGEVAGRELVSDPSVTRSAADLMKYLDKQKMESVFGSSPK